MTGFCDIRIVLRLTRLILIHLPHFASLTNVTQLFYLQSKFKLIYTATDKCFFHAWPCFRRVLVCIIIYCLLFVVSSTAVEYTQYKICVLKTTVLQGFIRWFNLIQPVINEVLLCTLYLSSLY